VSQSTETVFNVKAYSLSFIHI